jgi:hypothetical protein
MPLFSLFTERRSVAEDFRTIYGEAPDILRPVLSIRPEYPVHPPDTSANVK